MNRCACLLIQNAQGEYLLQMRDDAPGIDYPLLWDNFGGAVDEGEDLLHAAARELHEELGIEADPSDLEPVRSAIVGDKEECHICLKRTVEWGDFKVYEGAGAGFFTLAEIAKLPVTLPVKALFEALGS